MSLKPAIAKKAERQPNGPSEYNKVYESNLAGVRHFYRGNRPPWEFPTMIMSDPDRLRVEGYLAFAAAQVAASMVDA